MTPLIKNAGERIADLTDEIRKVFKPPVHVTVLVRSPDHPDGSRDFILTDDTLALVAAAILRRKNEPSFVGNV